MTDAISQQGDVRLAQVVGDRLCIKCAYNLSGQHIVREQHYNMLIVRCPECGTVASVQEYPLLGRWAGRWAVVLAGAWLVVLLLLWPASSGLMLGFAHMTAHEAAKPLMQFIGERQHEWAVFHDKVEEMRIPWDHYSGRHHEWMPIHSDWWDSQDPAVIRKEARQVGAFIEWRAFWPLAYLAFVMFPMGVVWSCLLPHVRRRWLPVAAIMIAGLSWTFWMIGSAFTGVYVTRLGEAVHAVVGSTYVAVAMGLLLVPMVAGLLLGRSVVRLMIHALLPPRLRSALASVWTIDGLEPPTSRSVSRWGRRT